MKAGCKTTIASTMNVHGVRVYIPEKMMVNGTRYVRPYTFMRVMASAQPFVMSFDHQATLSITLMSNQVVVTAPFSVALLRSYLGRASQLMADRGQISRLRVYPPNKPIDPAGPLGAEEPKDPLHPKPGEYYLGEGTLYEE